MVQSGNRSETRLFVITYPIQFVEFVKADLKTACKEFKLNTILSFGIIYADDTTIMFMVFEKLQLSTEELQAACRKWGIKINFSKCKVITSSEKRFILQGEELEAVGKFCFLDSITPSKERYVSRLRNAIFSNRGISTRLKARSCTANNNLWSEAWTLRSQEIQSLEMFEMRCRRDIRGVTRADRVQNTKIREDIFPLNLSHMSSDRRLRWFEHSCRIQRDYIIRETYKHDFIGQRKRGRPLKRWSDQIRNYTGFIPYIEQNGRVQLP